MARRALLVGINDYKGISDLQGCINDVTNMRDILKTLLGFTNANIRVLTDSRASKVNILSRLRWLVTGAKSGDFLVFHYSGHGSQVRDRNGDELSDGLDELICPWDMSWDGTYITDDDLNAVFSALPPGVLLEVFLDSCNSGTGLKAGEFGRPPELGPVNETRNRYLAPPTDIVCRSEGEEDTLQKKRLVRGTGKSQVHHILWSGCQDNQTSADALIAGSYNGAFTYYFCKIMRETGGQIKRSEILSRLRSTLRRNGYSQTPQLETEATVRSSRMPAAT
jgi:hypothetical protein